MRALVVGALVTCGCRQLLGLDDLPGGDAAVDARDVRDADPAMLALTRVSPSVIVEGTGSQGRPAILVVHGQHIVPGATVEIRIHDGGPSNLQLDHARLQVSTDGTLLAVPLVAQPDPALGAGVRVRLDVTVMQLAGSEVVMQTLAALEGDAPVLELTGLDELTGTNIALPPGVHEFSKVEARSISATTSAGGPLIIRSRSTVTLDGTSSVSASGVMAGPGGGNGGAGGTISSQGQVGAGPAGGLPSGGGGSYATKGGGNSPEPVGDAALATLDAPNRGSGGAGGNGTTTSGGAGGGGGGTIEITAPGPIAVGTILARGGSGASGASAGGGGSGGTILLRSGTAVSAMVVEATGGIGQHPGGVGRIRVDSAGDVPAMTAPPFYRGPMFAAETPVITTEAQPAFSVIGQPATAIRYYVTTADRAQLRGPFDATVALSGRVTLTPPEPLFDGLNLVCLVVEGGELERDEARNCIEVAYVY